MSRSCGQVSFLNAQVNAHLETALQHRDMCEYMESVYNTPLKLESLAQAMEAFFDGVALPNEALIQAKQLQAQGCGVAPMTLGSCGCSVRLCQPAPWTPAWCAPGTFASTAWLASKAPRALFRLRSVRRVF